MFRVLLPAAAIVGLWALSGADAQQGAVPTVSVVAAEKRAVAQSESYVGRIEAKERVDIRARVTGYLDTVHFQDGERVKAGALLYGIEKAPFVAALARAQAGVVRARADLENTGVQRRRADQLARAGFASEALRDDRIAAEKVSKGNVASAEADVKTAQIDLGYTDITAPIDGKIGRTAVTRGNVVSPDAGALATIVSVDPMYVTFPVSQRDFMRISSEAGARQPRASDFKVIVRFSNGTRYAKTGTINFVDVKVDRATDTVTVRATLPNPDGTLVDGQLVQVGVESSKEQQHVLIPQVALIADQEGPYVFIVDGGKAAIRRLKLGQVSGSSTIVQSGLVGGELVVVDGGQNLKPGVPVKAVPAAKPPGG